MNHISGENGNTADIERKKLLQRSFKLGINFPDKFFTDLDHLLLPLAGETFEQAAIQVARFIATEYGVKVTIMHKGHKDLSSYVKYFTDLKVKVDLKIKESGKSYQAIIDEANNSDYQLLVLPSRRRPKWIDRFIRWESVSEHVIPRVKINTLQVYEPKSSPYDYTSNLGFNKVAVLLPRSDIDLYLLFYANAMLSHHGKIYTYHFADLPSITPLHEAFDSEMIIDERSRYETLTDAYSIVFSTQIVPKFILAHNIIKAASAIMNADDVQPEIIFLGQSRHRSFWTIRTLSEKLIDKLKSPVAVHHFYTKK